MDLIKNYNEILNSKGYVQILSDELRLSININNKLRKYNGHSSKKNKINLDLKFPEKIKRVEYLLSLEENSELKELIELLELKQKFYNKGIKEQDISKKKSFIKEEIKKANPSIKLNTSDDILYDASRVCIERVNSLRDFSNKIKKYNLIKSGVYFRGQQNLNWLILPSVFRGKWIEHERDFIHELFISNSQDFEGLNTTLEKLTKMQHYNAPTRLLDLTSNPYVSLYFACERNDSSDLPYYSEVVFFKSEEKYFDSDTVSILSNLAMMKSDFKIGDESLSIEKFNKQGDIPYLLHQIKNEKPNFLNIINPEDLHKCFVVHVPYGNKRILNQQGLFLIVGMGNKKTESASIEDSLYKTSDGKKLIFIIPDSKKEKILEELNTMNINKRFVYPEIDDVSDYLKNYKFK